MLTRPSLIFKGIAFQAFLLLILFSCSSVEKVTERADNNNLSTHDKQMIEHLFYEAQKYKITDNPERSAEKFHSILSIDPSMDVAHFELAQYYYENNDIDRAHYHISRAADINPANHWYKKKLAGILSEKSEFVKAAEIYEDLIELFPGQKSYYDSALEMYMEAGEFSKALKILDNIEDLTGPNIQINFRRFQIHAYAGNREKALEQLKLLVEKNPDDVRFLEILANTYRQGADYDDAYEVYYRILEMQPTHASAQLALLNYYLRQNNREKVHEFTLEIIENPEIEADQKIQVHYEVFLSRGLPEGESDIALELAGELAGKYPESGAANALYGDVYYQLDDLKNAEKYYLKSLEVEKSVLPVWQNLFFIYLELGDFAALRDITDEAGEYFPNQGEIFFFNGIAQRELSYYQKAIHAFETALNLVFDNEVFRSEIYVQLADAWYQKKEYRKADNSFEKALELNPDNSVALNNYSYYLAMRNENLEKALAMSERSLELRPDNAAYMDTYGWINFQMGEYETAREWIKKALEIEPESVEITDHYGDVLYMLGKKEEAIRYWRKALDLSDNDDNIIRKIETGTLHEPEN
jgi:tetratricopeptide (TPR) repeat protein